MKEIKFSLILAFFTFLGIVAAHYEYARTSVILFFTGLVLILFDLEQSFRKHQSEKEKERTERG